MGKLLWVFFSLLLLQHCVPCLGLPSDVQMVILGLWLLPLSGCGLWCAFVGWLPPEGFVSHVLPPLLGFQPLSVAHGPGFCGGLFGCATLLFGAYGHATPRLGMFSLLDLWLRSSPAVFPLVICLAGLTAPPAPFGSLC